ncbi:ATP-binding protein [Pseudonocardia benzenivorans]
MPGHRRGDAAVPAVHRGPPRAGRRPARARRRAPDAAPAAPGSRPREEVTAGERDLGQLRVFDAVLSVLSERSAQDPLLLVLEDVHWADTSSRDLLFFLVSRLGGQRMLVLASYRGDDLHRRHPLRPLLAELVRLPAVTRIDLAALGAADAEQLVRVLADGTLSDASVARIARRSEGNAFFAEELVSASDEGVPDGLAEVLLARLDRLTPGARRVLRAAAVAGRRVRHERLAAVVGLDVDELEAALRSAVAHHILVADPAGRSVTAGDTYVFRHALLHEAIYQDLLPGERSRLHAAFAALLSPAAPATSASPVRSPSSPTTPSPRTTCRSRCRRRCARPTRPTGVAAPPRSCCTPNAR